MILKKEVKKKTRTKRYRETVIWKDGIPQVGKSSRDERQIINN